MTRTPRASRSQPPSSGEARQAVSSFRRGKGKRRLFFTIASANYAAHAATLMQSLRLHHPEAERIFVLADEVRDFSGIDLAATLLPVEDLGLPGFHNMKLWYDLLELNTAIKPFVFEAMIREGYEEICYLDPDILLFAPLTEVFAAFAEGAELILTPHLLAPLRDGKDPSDHTILKSGVYNLGFLALRPSPEVQSLLSWWRERCFTECRVDIAAHLFTDQRWMDLAPAFVARHFILRHPGYNVAYWNLAHRPVSRRKGRVHAGSAPLVFFHFSGYTPERPERLSRHESRFEDRLPSELRHLLDLYRERLIANGYPQVKRYRYAFAYFPDGRPIERPQRRWLLRALDEGRLDPTRPLPQRASFFDEPDETAAAQGLALSRTAYQFWLDRPDLRAAFDIFTPRGYDAYLDWLDERGTADHELDPRSVAAALRCAGRTKSRRRPAAAPPRPPWRSLAATAWVGPAQEARERWRGDVILRYGRHTLRLPVQAALAWEIRSDLRTTFPLTTLHSARAYLGWILTEGVAQNLVDPELFTPDFIDEMARVSEASRVWGDVPIAQGLLLLHPTAPAGHSPLATREGRLEVGIWYAYIAPARYRWPEAMVRPLREWFAVPLETGCPGLPFTRLQFALWEIRADLQASYPLVEPKESWAFLDWFLNRSEVDLLHPPQVLDRRLVRAFLSPSSAHPRLPMLFEFLAAVHPLLAPATDPASDAGYAIIERWYRTFFAETYGANSFFKQLTGLDFGEGFTEEGLTLPVPLTAAEMRPWQESETLRNRFGLHEAKGFWAYLEWLLTTDTALHGAPLGRLERLLAEPSPRREEIPLALELLAHVRPELDPAAPAARLNAWAEEEGVRRYRDTAFGRVLTAAMPAAPAETVRRRGPAHRVAVLLSGLWYEPTGRGEDLRGSAAALRGVGFEDFAILDRRSGALLRPDGTEMGGSLACTHHVVHLNADTALEDAQFFAQRGIAAERTIGFWAWELSRLPPRFRHAFSFYDEIWAATDFAAQAFAQEKLRPVRKVPLALLLPETVSPALPAGLILPPHAFLFLFTFDFRSYVRRKNPHAVIEAFMAAFPRGDEPVALLLKTQGGAEKPEDWQDLLDLAADPRIVLHDGPLERSAYLGLLAAADAFVSLHRAEGFGRGPAEAMWLGKPVILTAYSGTEDYATDETAFRIPFHLVPVEAGAYPGVEEGEAGGYYWAEPYVLEAAARLRLLLARPDFAAALGERGAMRVRTLYHPLRVGRAILEALGLGEASGRPAEVSAPPRRRRIKLASGAS